MLYDIKDRLLGGLKLIGICVSVGFLSAVAVVSFIATIFGLVSFIGWLM